MQKQKPLSSFSLFVASAVYVICKSQEGSLRIVCESDCLDAKEWFALFSYTYFFHSNSLVTAITEQPDYHHHVLSFSNGNRYSCVTLWWAKLWSDGGLNNARIYLPHVWRRWILSTFIQWFTISYDIDTCCQSFLTVRLIKSSGKFHYVNSLGEKAHLIDPAVTNGECSRRSCRHCVTGLFVSGLSDYSRLHMWHKSWNHWKREVVRNVLSTPMDEVLTQWRQFLPELFPSFAPQLVCLAFMGLSVLVFLQLPHWVD